MKTVKYFFLFFILFSFASCSSSPEPINWGKDMCAHCKMTIVDQKFGAEIFTKKGKTYKFDAAECMLAYVNKDYIKQEDVAQYLVSDASNPGTLADAKSATYLISEKLPSPMGGNLSAYAVKSNAETQQKQHGGDLHDWNSVMNVFKNK